MVQEEKPNQIGDNRNTRDEKGRFIKGIAPNPNGRPKGTLSLVAILKQILAEIPEGEKETNAVILMKEAIRKASGKNSIFGGDASMLKDIINRVDGLPKQPLEHSGPEGEPLSINVISFKDSVKDKPG